MAVAVAGLMVGSSAAAAASPPWWVGVVGAGAGAAIGSIGGPVGAISGAVGGALLADYIYSIATQSSHSAGSTTATYRSYAGSVFNTTLNQIALLNSQLGTESNLTTTSYYFFAQAMESETPNFLNQSTLNATYLGWDSGMYAAADNLSRSAIFPLNNLLFTTFNWEVGNSYPTYIMDAYPYSSFVGNALTNGTEYFITPSSDFYFVQNQTVVLQNIFSGAKYYINESLSMSMGQAHANDAGSYTTEAGWVWAPAYVAASQIGITSPSVYKVVSISAPINKIYGSTTYPHGFQTGYSSGPGTISATYVSATDAISIASTGAIAMNYVVQTTNGFGFSGGTRMIGVSEGGSSGNLYSYGLSSLTPSYGGAVATMISQVQSIMSNAFTTAKAYFTQLKNLGYTQASQVPIAMRAVLPSYYLPDAFLNGSFNSTELQALYAAYLLQIKTWFSGQNVTNFKRDLNVTNATFANGFTQIYGNLTVLNGTSKTYYNDTWFLPLIDVGVWHYKVDSWSNITNGTPDPNWLITSGADEGQIIALTNATFYTTGISVNGTSVDSATVRAATIGYVLPATNSIGGLHTGGFFATSQLGLPVWEWITIVFITAGIIGVVYSARRKKR